MLYVLSCLFFFFKQKTAYEMRISDWSSDVCSSDLGSAPARPAGGRAAGAGGGAAGRHARAERGEQLPRPDAAPLGGPGGRDPTRRQGPAGPGGPQRSDTHGPAGRSEEHTSELQSLMRSSYAVFYLNKKKITKVIISKRNN